MAFRRKFSFFLAMLLLLAMIPYAGAANEGEQVVRLHSEAVGDSYTHSASLNGREIEEFADYVWHVNPEEDHDAVKNAPAEYYSGEKPATDAAAYISHDIFYYPSLPVDRFEIKQYDDDREWCYYYPESSAYHNYIFATLPVDGPTVPERMMHTPEEAYQNAVLHIRKAGTYRLTGDWHGQIWVDLGDGDRDATFSDPDAKVRLILDGVNVNCTVAPALVFYGVYECDCDWEQRDVYSASVDTSQAGAVLVIADGSVNNLSGQNIYRMLRTAYKSDDSQNPRSAVKVQKKQRKIDGTLYSFVTMRIDGEGYNSGVLNIRAGFEGLDSELHLTINGGNVNIFSQDDGINVNEDGVSVLTFNGGNVHILAGLGMEGDGIDSNGYLVVNGGTLVTMANPRADSGMDSDRGTYVNGGTVVALGSTMDWAEDEGTDFRIGSQAAMNLQFASAQSADEAIIVTDTERKVVFAYDPDKDEVAGNNARWYQGAIISSPDIVVGKTYHVYVGGDVDGSDLAGIYDISTVNGFSAAAKQQCYSASGSFQRPGPPPDFDPNNPQGPGGPPPGGPDGMFALANRNGDRQFVTSGKVNGFQAVTDYVGSRFKDVNEDSAFYNAIMWSVGTGVAEGGTDTEFEPNKPCTRGETVLYFWRAAGSPRGNMFPGQGGMGQPDPNTPPAPGGMGQQAAMKNPFSDVTEDSPYYYAILWAVQSGITNGMSETTFGPDVIVTRAQSQTFLYRWAGEPETSGTTPFSDVSEGTYYYDPVRWSVENGITNGVTPNSFEPNGTLSKAQILTFLYRYVNAGFLSRMMGGPPPMP